MSDRSDCMRHLKNTIAEAEVVTTHRNGKIRNFDLALEVAGGTFRGLVHSAGPEGVSHRFAKFS